MRKRVFLLLFLIGTSGCVPKHVYLNDVKEAYRKGLKVGRVIGRDDVLGQLKSPDCFTQKVDSLMDYRDDQQFLDKMRDTVEEIKDLARGKK
jgi:hypothetical protein